MATFGKLTDGASTSTDSVDNKIASQATPASGGVVQSLTARVWLSGAGSGNLRGFIYSDLAGEPDVLLAVTDDISYSNATEQALTMNFTGANQITLVSGTPYWIGVHYEDPGAINFTISRDATANLRRVGGGDTFVGGTASPFGSATTLSGPIDVYVTYNDVTGPAGVKTVNGVTKATMKTNNGVVLNSIKSINGVV